MKLSPLAIDALANCICGGEGTSIEYRSGTSIDRFRAFAGADVKWEPGRSRFYDAVAYLDACNETPVGQSGLPRALEKVIAALADRRLFASDAAQELVLADLQQILEPYDVHLQLGARRELEFSTPSSRGQQVIDEEIHTAFETLLRESDLDAAREHYPKARRFLSASEPDFANAGKEGVCVVESLLLALTEERDFNKAVAKAVATGLIPRPLGELIKKLYAYRGDEPGVAHAAETMPDVDVHDARFVVNLAATIGLYLRAKLVGD